MDSHQTNHSLEPDKSQSAVGNRRFAGKFILAVSFLGILGWVCAGQIACLMATRYVSRGRLTSAAGLIPWTQRLCPWDASLDELAASTARHRGDREAWTRIITSWAAKSPDSKELKLERELMQVQSGAMDANSQAQIKRLIMSEANATEIAEAFVLGYLAHQNTDQAKVVLAWWETMNLRPCDAKLYRGVLARTLGERDLAKKEYRSILVECPHHELAQIHLADLMLETGSPTEALNHFMAAFRESPKSVAAQVGIARCLRKLGKWTAAEALLKPLLNQTQPADEVVHEYGQIALEKGDFVLAETHLSAGNNTRVSTADSRIALATVFALQGRPAEGLTLIRRDDQVESLQKWRRDLQIENLLEPENGTVRRQLREISEELTRIGP